MRSFYYAVTVCACFMILPASHGGSAQKPEEGRMTAIKKQMKFSKWQKLMSSKPEIRYGAFEVTDEMVSPWRIRRSQSVEVDGRCSMTSSVLTQSDDPKKTQEIVRISVTRCPTRAAASERLIHHLLGVQRPDYALVEDEAMTIGDITVHIPGTPEPALFFVRSNFLVTVETAGEKVPADIRKLARELDNHLKSKKQ